MSKTSKRLTGDWGENQASIFLTKNDYHIAEKNYQIRGGEIDIIAWKNLHGDNTLCFIEVKTRKQEKDGSAERATSNKKLGRIFQAAKHYCLNHDIKIDSTPIRFEQISVYITKERVDCLHYIIPVD